MPKIRSRAPAEPYGFDFGAAASFRFGVPLAKNLQFFGNAEYETLFARSIDTLRALGGEPVPIDLAPFLEAARLLYEGPWVAERYAAIREFFDAHADALHPVTREITAKSRAWLAADAYEALYRLKDAQAPRGCRLGERRLHRHADGAHALSHRRGRGRSDPPERQSRLLHELHEPAGLRGDGGAGGVHARGACPSG